MKKVLLLALSLIIMGCGTMEFADFSRNMKTAEKVDLGKYLGTWYEYARLEVSFEKGMTKTTANYTLLEPDRQGRTRVQVLNSGIKPGGKFTQARGKAVLPDPAEPGRLKVSFFGPFYADYNMIALDEVNYQWVLVAGSSTKYLWFLSRTPQMDPNVFARLKSIAEGYGYDTSALIYPQ
ncbi:MAG: lipocalin family protein [Candidatus Marinimicrobia bacterium]|nr:lipocalin family protein [Candidatus Neomarinimicrobiota bacterium]